jgi:N-acetylglucosaminyl-diphospho-decaprenol L-rhamnosyltransferase
MILSVVIVSYNVKFFLEQCLSSLKKAVGFSDLLVDQVEVLIIDNASQDGSLDFLSALFPAFHFIQNQYNVGFAKANNQALRLCNGEFILFLNPDTILAEDSLDLCVSFLRSTPLSGALGVRMIDGRGNYLRESKRGFPGPATSFFKMAGLSLIFPRSKVFSGYYLGHLDDHASHAVDILSGAFMMVKKSVLDLSGGFDEQFFMYGEDIDLSYRISKAGYINYYFAETTVIHFKGESSQKDLSYLRVFYAAMELFTKKHFGTSRPFLQKFLLTPGIRIRQFFAALALSFKKAYELPTYHAFFLKGDPEDVDELKKKLVNKKYSVSEDENKEAEIIYCEGAQHSWKTIIAKISGFRSGSLYRFHGTKTHAIVTSSDGGKTTGVIEI